MMRLRSIQAAVIAALGLPAWCSAAPITLDHYVRGVAIDAAAQRPLVQVDLPDVVYRTVATDDLSDVRVFNADGVPVPHALCARPDVEPPTITQEALPVYPLQDVPRGSGDPTRVEVQTPSGAQISVEGGAGAGTGDRQTSAYVIDARDISDALRALQFEWRSPDGASEVRVSIQASEDLDRWRTLVAGTTLLRVDASDRIARHRVAIPESPYQYLRVERIDRGPPLQIDGVAAERVTPAAPLEPTWFTPLAGHTSEPNTYEFDAARRAPVSFARLVPTQENTSLQITLESRPADKAPWISRWMGETYSILTETERRVSPPAQFAPTTHALWRVRLTKQGDAFYQPPALELGYRPARLRFVAQGAGPYTLAFGSRRAEPAPTRDCGTLLTNLTAAELQDNIDLGYPGAERTLGGDDALRPLPKQTPVRQVVLWGVLVLGVGSLVAMALSLLRRLKPDGTA